MSKSEDNLREGFEGLSDALGTEFEMEASDGGVSKESPSEGIVEVSEKTLPFSDTSENVMSDEEEKYIDVEIKETIHSVSEVMDVLQDDLKVGAEARKFEVYATLATAKINAVNSYRDLKLAKKKIFIEERKIDIRAKASKDKEGDGDKHIHLHKYSVEDLKKLSKEVGL